VVNTIADEIVGIRDTISKLERIYEQLLEFIVGYINYEYLDLAYAKLEYSGFDYIITVKVRDRDRVNDVKAKLLNEDETIRKLYGYDLLFFE